MIVTLSTVIARVALPRVNILENIIDGQIIIFQVMGDINKLGKFTKEYLPTDQNLLSNQNNHPRKKVENDDFATNLERDNKLIISNGTHREGRQFGGLIAAASSFIPKFLVSNIVQLF